MVPELPDPYVSHSEPEALIPNRIDRERSTVTADIIADLARMNAPRDFWLPAGVGLLAMSVMVALLLYYDRFWVALHGAPYGFAAVWLLTAILTDQVRTWRRSR